MHRKQSLLIAEALVLAVFLGEGACDSICPNGITNITASSGSLKYPTSGNYGVNETKCWKIEIPDIYSNIRIQFYSFDIESCKRCECDRLTVSRYYNDLDRQSVSSDCGGKNYSFLYEYLFFAHLGKRKRRILGSTAYIRFVSDDTGNYRGFNFTFIAGSGEGGVSNYLNASEDETITFGTPKAGVKNYPKHYGEEWCLIVPEGRQVQIDFDMFDLEDSKGCKNDYVEFREAEIEPDDPKTITGRFGPILTGRLCGKTKPGSIKSKGSIVWVLFKSDRNSTTVYKGFKASFKAVLAVFLGGGACDLICPNGITNITASSGRLKYPTSGNYGANEIKCWKIEVTDTYQGIRFQYNSYDIESCKDCECDSLKVSNTYNGLDQQLGKTCGRSSYNNLYEYLGRWSDGNFQRVLGSIAYIRFVSDDTEHYKGFSLAFTALSDSGGVTNYLNAPEDETITFDTQKFGSQNYPTNGEEEWYLIVPVGRQVQIDFDTFDLEDSKDCRNDYVELREAISEDSDGEFFAGDSGPILTKRLCGKTKPGSIKSKGSIVWVNFKSDGNSTTVYKGFKASFKAVVEQGGSSVSNPSTLLFVSALMMVASKNILF